METVKYIVILLIVIDVFSSIISFIDLIPIGSPFTMPRFPLVITLIIIIIQTKQRSRTFYCEKCSKNLSASEVRVKCSCGKKNKVKFMGLSGKLYYKCSNRDCEEAKVTSFKNVFIDDGGIGVLIRARLPKINPYRESNQIVCSVCGEKLSGESVINMSLFSCDMNLAKRFREDFFYHAFGPAKQSKNISITSRNASLLKDIDKHYEKGKPASVTPDSIRVYFKTENEDINQTLIQFNIALAENKDLQLKSSEGIIVLLDAAKDPIERQSAVDFFLLETARINTRSSIWQAPVLVGLCCDKVDELESEIDSGKIKNADDSEELCINFLSSHNNGDIVQRLCKSVENIHFFLYRTGSIASNDEDKVYNIVPPVQALFYTVSNDFRSVWEESTEGYLPKTIGQKRL